MDAHPSRDHLITESAASTADLKVSQEGFTLLAVQSRMHCVRRARTDWPTKLGCTSNPSFLPAADHFRAGVSDCGRPYLERPFPFAVFAQIEEGKGYLPFAAMNIFHRVRDKNG